jgi:hypothetical protein
VKLYVQRKAKGEKAYAGEAPGVARPTRKELAVAFGWYWIGLLDDGVVEDQAELARRLGVSRARVSQGMARRHQRSNA